MEGEIFTLAFVWEIHYNKEILSMILKVTSLLVFCREFSHFLDPYHFKVLGEKFCFYNFHSIKLIAQTWFS